MSRATPERGRQGDHGQHGDKGATGERGRDASRWRLVGLVLLVAMSIAVSLFLAQAARDDAGEARRHVDVVERDAYENCLAINELRANVIELGGDPRVVSRDCGLKPE